MFVLFFFLCYLHFLLRRTKSIDKKRSYLKSSILEKCTLNKKVFIFGWVFSTTIQICAHFWGTHSLRTLWHSSSQISIHKWEINQCCPFSHDSQTKKMQTSNIFRTFRASFKHYTQQIFTCFKSTKERLEKIVNKIYSNLTIKKPEELHWLQTGVFSFNFEHICRTRNHLFSAYANFPKNYNFLLSNTTT